MKYLIIQDRESLRWFVAFRMPFRSYMDKRKRRYKQSNYVYPKPEDVSCFVKAHKIIEAENEDDLKLENFI